MTMKRPYFLLFVFLFSFENLWAKETPTIPEIDRIRLAEAFQLKEAISKSLWENWKNTVCTVLLVTPDYEFLIRHPDPSHDFESLGYDALLQSDVYYRKRTQRINLMAAFPVIKGSSISTIVIGQAENTLAKTSTPWVVSLLHEHFHQLQHSHPTYHKEVNNLNLSRGDKTGMWMLKYPFPYENPKIQQRFSVVSTLLADVLESKTDKERDRNISSYLHNRQEFEKLLTSDDYKYFSFQLWQEGIARYTEYHVAKLASTMHEPGEKFRTLKDFTAYSEVAETIYKNIIEQLTTSSIKKSRRVAFYSFGAAEGLLLDIVNPGWRNRYLTDKFELKNYYNKSK